MTERIQMDSSQLAGRLAALGCPASRVDAMALQLERRARQLANQHGRPYEESLAHLLGLFSQGWAAQVTGSSGPNPDSPTNISTPAP